MNNDPITDEDLFRSHRFMREIARGNIPHETKHLAAMRDEAIRERDEARRDCCWAESNTRYWKRPTPTEYAELRGWDCFKETTP